MHVTETNLVECCSMLYLVELEARLDFALILPFSAALLIYWPTQKARLSSPVAGTPTSAGDR